MFPVTIATVDSIRFSGDAVSLTALGREGEVTILRHHAPFATALREGTIIVRTPDGERSFPVTRGILEVHREGATVLL